MLITDEDASYSRLNNIFLGLALFWSVAIIALVSWNYRQAYMATFEVARSSANQSYMKDLVYRSWATGHGGVYVPITPETPPNPYLAGIPERDISTPSGKRLTLLNPAYMTRQIHELGKKDYGIIGHITSLKPIRPENAPDEWEENALLAFHNGKREVSSVEPLANETFLRLMRPLITETGCLRCHAVQGYRAGDIRGGISVSVPWAPFREALRSQLFFIIPGYGVIWIIGLSGLYISRGRIRDHLHKRRLVEEALEEERGRLQKALDEVMTLRGIVPICAYCKKIRDDKGYWTQVEKYVSDHTDAKFSHGICPVCFEEEMKKIETSA